MPSPLRKSLAQNRKCKDAEESRQIQYRELRKALQVRAARLIPYVMRKCKGFIFVPRCDSLVQFKLTVRRAVLYFNTRFCPQLHESKFQFGYRVGTPGERAQHRWRSKHQTFASIRG